MKKKLSPPHHEKISWSRGGKFQQKKNCPHPTTRKFRGLVVTNFKWKKNAPTPLAERNKVYDVMLWCSVLICADCPHRIRILIFHSFWERFNMMTQDVRGFIFSQAIHKDKEGPNMQSPILHFIASNSCNENNERYGKNTQCNFRIW